MKKWLGPPIVLPAILMMLIAIYVLFGGTH